MTQLKRIATLVFICSIPLCFSLPTLGDPYGQTEEGVNNAIWALGGRNLLRHGPWSAKLGAVVAPYPGTGGGTYAHHPPLPTWTSAIFQVLTDREAAPRLVALLLAGVSLGVLFSILRQCVSDVASLLSVAVVALSPWVLPYSRMLTTLTMATPLFVLLLRSVLQRLHQNRPFPVGTLIIIAGLVLSSWDEVIGAAPLVAVLSWIELRDAGRQRRPIGRWFRAVTPAVSFLLTLVLLFAYLTSSNDGSKELVDIALWRSDINEFPLPALIRREFINTANGLGWITMLLIVLASFGWRKLPSGRQLLVAGLLSAAPGVGMILLFRNGAINHEFWGYNLFVPAAFAPAVVIEWSRTQLPRLATVGLLSVLGVQALLATRSSASQLEREHQLNQLGSFLKQNF